MSLLQLSLLLLIQSAHLLNLLHRLKVHIPDLLLDDRLFARLWLQSPLPCLVQLLLSLTSLGLSSLHLSLLLLLLTGLLTVLMRAGMFALVPPAAAHTWSRHDSDWHLNISAVLLMDSFHLFQALYLELEGVDLLHQDAFVCFLEIHKSQILKKMNLHSRQ